MIHQKGSCTIEFGDSNRRMPVNNSVSPPFLDKDRHTFKLHVLNSSAKSTHQKNQRFKHKTKFREHDRNIWSAVKIVIPPETSVAVPVLANFPSGSNCLYVEKVCSTNRNTDNIYAPPDSLILKTNTHYTLWTFLPLLSLFKLAKCSGKDITQIPGLTTWESTPLRTSRIFMHMQG